MNKCELYLKQEIKLYKKATWRNKEDWIEFFKWILKNGELFKKVDLETSLKVSKELDSTMKHCFKNCWDVLQYYPQLKYYTGYAWNDTIPLPLEHSWLVDKNGIVIEPTFIIYERKFSENYFGVNIPSNILNKLVSEKQIVTNHLFDYFMSIKGEIKIEIKN